MEKTIRFIEGAHTEKGVSYWKVEFADGDRATVWDKGIAAALEPGKSYDLIIKTSPDGKFNNIRGINSETISLSQNPQGAVVVNTPSVDPTILHEVKQGERSINGQSQRPDRDKSIVAQCLVKSVIGQPKNFVEELVTIEQAVEMYNKAYSLL